MVRTQSKSLWCWDKPWATRTHKTHHGPDLGGSHHLPPYSILCDSPRGGIQMAILSRDSRAFSGLPRLWGFITFGADLRWTRRLKQSCRSRRDLSNGMSHVQNWRTPGSSTPGPSFGHNLCFRCPNEQCEPILGIYTSRPFHCYKERNKPWSFDPSKRSLKFRESFWDSNFHQLPTWEFTWECEGSLPHTLCTPGGMWYDSRVYL